MVVKKQKAQTKQVKEAPKVEAPKAKPVKKQKQKRRRGPAGWKRGRRLKFEIEKGGKVVEISSMVTPGGVVRMRVMVMTGRGEVVQTMELA